MKDSITKECKHCGVIHSPREVKRIYGKLSRPYILGYCSAQCYTMSIFINKPVEK